jgi:hypothetical protein
MKATYYSAVNSPCLLNVVEGKAAKVGLVDLANDSGDLIVTDCPVNDSPKAGHAVLAKAEKLSKK